MFTARTALSSMTENPISLGIGETQGTAEGEPTCGRYREDINTLIKVSIGAAPNLNGTDVKLSIRRGGLRSSDIIEPGLNLSI